MGNLKYYSIKKENDKYMLIEHDVSKFNSDDEIDDWMEERGDVIMRADDQPIELVVEVDGKVWSWVLTWEDVEFEFEDEIVEVLKTKGEYEEFDYSDDPDDDDIRTHIKVFNIDSIKN